MRKMLVVLLILFSKVLADSEENSYVDLLPDEEKEQFLEKVARRIYEDVESQEDVTHKENVDVSDEVLKQHSDYVKAVFKEEQANFRKSKTGTKDKREITSVEYDALDVKPLKTKRMAEDMTSEIDNFDNTTTKIIEKVSDNDTIPNTSIQDDNVNKGAEIEEATAEKTNITKEQSSEVRGSNENVDNGNITIEAKAMSTNDSKEIIKVLDSKEIQLTESNSTTSAVEHLGIKSSENSSDTYNNEFSESVTTITSDFKNDSTNGTLDENKSIESISNENNSTESGSSESISSENTTTDDLITENATLSAKKNQGTEPEIKFSNNTSESTENDLQTTAETPQKSYKTSADNKSTNPSQKITGNKMTEKTTESIVDPLTTTNPNKPDKKTQDEKINVEDFTSASTPATTSKPILAKSKVTKSEKKLPLTKETTTEIPHPKEEPVEVATKKIVKTTEPTITERIKHKAIVHKLQRVIIGPKAKKNMKTQSYIQNNDFIELKKTYYDNNYKVKTGKEYHVFEIPDGASPFIKDEEPVADQPYYVPVYNYSPNNAYFNPLNRLGPNAGDKEDNFHFIDDINIDNDDSINQQFDKTETIDAELENDRQRKKFGSKHSRSTTKHHTLGIVNPADYLDFDYYYGSLRDELAKTARRDTGNNIPEGNLKDYIEAVRNILFKNNNFGVFHKDDISIERIIRKNPDIIYDLDGKSKKILDNQNNIVIDLFKEEKNNENFQKFRYLKEQRDTKEIYVLNKSYKADVENYLKEQTLTPVTPRPNQAVTSKNLKNIKVIVNIINKKDENREINKIRQDRKPRYSIKIETTNSEAQKALNGKFNRRKNAVVTVDTYLQVLNDMITLDNKALIQYDWLGTTVDIQAALQKLLELTTLVANDKEIHPSDMEILKYLLFLHKLASEIIEAKDVEGLLRKKLILPRNKRKKVKPRLLKEKGLFNRVWLLLRKEREQVNEYGALKQLNTFLMNIEAGLFDLHEAVKNIAKITKYNNQHWYQNLKELYIDLDRKHLLELLLHITALRLFSHIEESSRNGLEEDYIQYMKDNRDHSKRTLEEMIFILKILVEYKKNVE